MILTALKAGQEDSQREDIKFMTSALKEMRFTAKVFGPYRAVKKVTIFGSAHINPTTPFINWLANWAKSWQEQDIW